MSQRNTATKLAKASDSDVKAANFDVIGESLITLRRIIEIAAHADEVGMEECDAILALACQIRANLESVKI